MLAFGDWLSHGLLPEPGAMKDQARKFVVALRLAAAEKGRIEAEERALAEAARARRS